MITAITSEKKSFPHKLYTLLENENPSSDCTSSSAAITWLPHGRAFIILDQHAFITVIVPKYFKQTKLRSFVRQLNLWGFIRCVTSSFSFLAIQCLLSNWNSFTIPCNAQCQTEYWTDRIVEAGITHTSFEDGPLNSHWSQGLLSRRRMLLMMCHPPTIMPTALKHQTFMRCRRLYQTQSKRFQSLPLMLEGLTIRIQTDRSINYRSSILLPWPIQMICVQQEGRRGMNVPLLSRLFLDAVLHPLRALI